MLGGADPTSVLGSSTDLSSAAAPIRGAHDGGGGGGGDVGSNSGTDEDKGRGDDGDRSFGGNRWPRQETLALLKIRSDMDQVFRDSSLKGPLWEEVSRKLAELGYNRSSKKCKEKFENVYKYHKRTKEGRSGKSEGKHYKFFDQLEAFDNHNQNHHRPIHQPPQKPQTPMQTTPPIPWPNIAPTTTTININPSTINPINFAPPPTPPTTNPTVSTTPPTHNISGVIPSSFPNNFSANLFSSSTSSSTASDEETEDVGDYKRKRKWKEFFKRITKQVIRKQEELQDKFLIAIEKREHERVVREEAWRVQELARINREHEILIQERSTSAAKDAAVIAFLQKIAGQQQNYPTPQITPPPAAAPPPPPPPPLAVTNLDTSPKHANNGGNNNGVLVQSSSRWPKAEIEALIQLRTDLSLKYQENGPKGPLWEEISAGMRGLGYNRSAKRCKEKWENINKYFKKVKDSNKKRPQDSKTCPYFSQLDALYREKSKIDQNSPGYGNTIKPVINTMIPLMVQPEQQRPLQPENAGRNNADQIQDQEEEEDDDDVDDDGDSEEEYEVGGYEIVANKAASTGTSTGE